MPRGRPKGSTNKRKMIESSSEFEARTKIPVAQKITCLHCRVERSELQFFTNRWSLLWEATDKRVPICKSCLNDFQKKWTELYGAEVALEIICHYLDLPFVPAHAAGVDSAGDYIIGDYVKSQNLHSQRYSTYADTIAKHISGADSDESSVFSEGGVVASTPKPARWTQENRKNQKYVISVIGFDPYSNSPMSDADKMYCYNVLAGYCDNDGVSSDGHKIQCIIQMANNHLQCKRLDDQIFAEYQKEIPDLQKVSDLTRSKKDLVANSNQMASENNISSKHNKTSKAGKNTLAQKMKDMLEDDYWPAKQNLMDAKASEAIMQVARLSHQSIFEQLMLDENDIAKMVAEQREMIIKLQSERDGFEEEARNLKNQLADLAGNSKRGA